MKILHSPEQLNKLCKTDILSKDLRKALTFTYILEKSKESAAIITNIKTSVVKLENIVQEELGKYDDYIGKKCLIPIENTIKIDNGYITEYKYVEGRIISKPQLDRNELYSSIEFTDDDGFRQIVCSNLKDLKDI